VTARPGLLGEPAPLQGRLLVSYARTVSGGLVLLGLIGIFKTGFRHFSNVTGHDLFVFTVNPQTNLIHLIAGLVGIAMALTPTWSRRYALLVGFLGLPWAIAGFMLDGSLSDFFATNRAMNVMHLVIAVVGLGLALWPVWPAERRAAPAAV
jgi:uncharacterized protein DUF4383